jgi:hypothetical protein
VKPDTVAQNTTIPKEELNTPTADPLSLPKIEDPGIRWIDESNQALAGLAQLDKDARQKLFNSLGDRSRGQGGSGSGGGKGAGHGTGTGAGTAPGEGKLTTRQKRVLRWVIDFDLHGEDDQTKLADHLRQLAGVGAILALPDPQGRFHVFRDLTARPLIGRVEDVSNINRIWFVDRRPQSVAVISRALGVPGVRLLVAFFPQSLEQHLVKLEEEFRGKKEDDIREQIRFLVVRRGGEYDVIVNPDQRLDD